MTLCEREQYFAVDSPSNSLPQYAQMRGPTFRRAASARAASLLELFTCSLIRTPSLAYAEFIPAVNASAILNLLPKLAPEGLTPVNDNATINKSDTEEPAAEIRPSAAGERGKDQERGEPDFPRNLIVLRTQRLERQGRHPQVLRRH